MLQAFEQNFYLANNPDVLAAVRNGTLPSAEYHYINYGEGEGRKPNQFFDPTVYLSGNPDVLAAVEAGVFNTGLQHYSMYGAAEGRSNGVIQYDNAYYLEQNPDVAAAVEAGVFESGFDHFVMYGAAEDRSPAPGVTPPSPEGDTFTLTENTDTAVANTFFGDLKILEGQTVNTLNNADQLTGTGDSPTLNVQLQANVAPAKLENISEINLEATAAATLNAINATGVETVNLSNLGGNAGVTNLQAALTNASITNNNAFNTNITIADNALSGSEDTVSLALSGLSASTVTLDGVAGNEGYETINLTSRGSISNTFTTLNAGGSNSTTTLNIDGAQDLAITGALDTNVVTLNGSTAEGDLGLQTSNVTGNLSVELGAGDDGLYVAGAGALDTDDSVDGGEGANTLRVDDADVTGLTASTALNDAIANFQTLDIVTALAAGAAVRLDRVDEDIANLIVTAATAGAATLTFNAGESTLEYNTAPGGTQTLDAAGAETDDALTLTVDTGAAAALTGGLTVTDFETLTVIGEDGPLTTNAISMAASAGGTTTLNFQGDQNIVAGAGNIYTADVINASGLTDNATLTMSTVQAAADGEQRITGSGNDDTLFGSDATTGDAIDGGAGDDVIEGGVGGDGLTGGAGADDFVYTTAGGQILTSLATAVGGVLQADLIADFTSGTDEFDVTTTPTVLAGSFGAAGTIELVNLAGVASTGTTVATLVTDIGTAVAAAGGAGAFGDDAGDSLFFTLSGDSVFGTDAGVLVIDANGDGAFAAADDGVIGLAGVTSLTLTDFV